MRLGVLMIAGFVALLSACASQPLRELLQLSKGAGALSTGLREYEDGDYAEAARNLQGAIDLGLTDGERANAHKHLAFIHCAAGRERPCRDEFRRALSADPTLELEPAEAGHPVWGPIFRAVKAGR